jgi:hypothetical protein
LPNNFSVRCHRRMLVKRSLEQTNNQIWQPNRISLLVPPSRGCIVCNITFMMVLVAYLASNAYVCILSPSDFIMSTNWTYFHGQVQKSVQVLQDKQELAKTQKELNKLSWTGSEICAGSPG